jgi:hypothetical protein
LRNIVLTLLLANCLVFAWTRWIAPAPVAEPALMDVPAAAKRLVLYRRDGAPAATAVVQSSAVVDTTLHCERIGPFGESATAAMIGEQLGARGMVVDLSSESGNIWVGHWVQVVNLPTAEQAARAVERLIKAGVRDAYIVQTEPMYNISLGVFRDRSGADRAMKIAAAADLDYERMDRYREGQQFWVNVTLRDGDALDLTSLRLEQTQILRAELTGCGVEVDSNGDDETDLIESVAEVADYPPQP